MTEYEPIANQWYRHLDKGFQFQVVAVDEDERIVEIQYFDGDLEQLDLDAWAEMDLELIQPPEDWTGSVDDVETDDLGYTETDMSERDWSKPLEERGEQAEQGWSTESEEEEEEGESEEGEEERR